MLCIITGGRELVEYEIQLEALHTETVNHISRAIVKIVFRRNMMFHVTNTFLQTGLLVAVGGLTLFFAIDNFTDRIMVTLTTLLVIATVTASIQAASTLSAPTKAVSGRVTASMHSIVPNAMHCASSDEYWMQ